MQQVLGPPRLEEVVAVGAELFRAELADASRAEGRPDLRRFALPEAWREREGKRRAPASLRVFLDGAVIPFRYREPQQWPPELGPSIAYYVSPRLSTLVVRCGPAAACRQ